MLLWFYRLPIWFVFVGTILIICFYSNISSKCKHTHYLIKFFNLTTLILLLFSCYLIYYATIYNRYNVVDSISLIPFISFIEAQIQPEIYRTLLMNVVLFVPLGLTLSNALNIKLHTNTSIIITVITSLIISILIEIIQFYFKCGNAQTDDVLMNVFGAFLGSINLILSKSFTSSYLKKLYFN